jgi:hypothetical protein
MYRYIHDSPDHVLPLLHISLLPLPTPILHPSSLTYQIKLRKHWIRPNIHIKTRTRHLHLHRRRRRRREILH